jgi:quercetin dioxygenase-like cupin family protein
MVEVRRLTPSFSDERGVIQDILVNEQIDHVTMITTVKGVVRGNHYHKDTVQWLYLLSGKLKYLAQKGDGDVTARILLPGDLLTTPAMEKHAVIALEESVFFVFTKGPRGGMNYEKDTYRLESPLKDPESNE